ncbi:hypothetical protein F3Y22_tig00010968pilonHSYRG00201 [Hibiscus syriacus]|uniref:Uncharacterized protein n=1 Tax=Hibiscus syriacus TaxID=106335 RepID=A0A6A3C4G9_HIBSY|nr:hypothetical protein F3Y22_tig00010968pilonHSYRG00201 [Hibiscus syriacus]
MALLAGCVSDLLDYINPNPDAKGKDVAAGKKRSYMKLGWSLICGERIHPSSCEESPKEGENKASDEETRVSEPEDKLDANQEVSSLPVPSQASVAEEATEARSDLDNHIPSESHAKGMTGGNIFKGYEHLSHLGRD